MPDTKCAFEPELSLKHLILNVLAKIAVVCMDILMKYALNFTICRDLTFVTRTL